ncbi:hemin ABC transporter substrate-binding protein [Sphingobacterium spiritivorum]|uniref:heme/hemin ABC transporter substrate-binding protein n=1 Tax=Sphingobacterium spiritivorum TaxID=258 RepID=UPI001918080A|nr:ABC transporter substrate-binding protein [Sphingobacterium spiritivorum]QQT25806.1 ABC transporter substrate-binding protein [Sphingobacterium spiritivorum]
MTFIHKLLSCFLFFICISASVYGLPKRIITLSSSLTETVYALGYGSAIVATDVTSVSPAAASALPKVSKNRSVSAEVLIAYQPDLILAPEGDVGAGVIRQLKSAGIRFVTVKQIYSAKGAVSYVQTVAQALGDSNKGKTLATKLSKDMAEAQAAAQKNLKGRKPKVLFVYARGTGTMSVAGKGSSLDAIIELSGGRNAVQEFTDYKPYTTESLVKANPDIILMFDFGVSSLGGRDAVLKMPGMRVTEAGKNKRIIQMNGPLLINFSTRLPEAVAQLNKAIVASL